MNQSPIRILHVIGIMNRGGAETMIMNLYRHIDREKVQFDFVENSLEPAAFDEEIRSLGGRIYRCMHYNGKNHFAYVRWWKQFFRDHAGEFAAVHGHLGSTAAIYLSVAKKAGLFTIAHSHNTGRRTLSGLLYQAYAYPTRYLADFFFGCSVDAGISRYGRKVCANPYKFKVLNNAIETEQFAFAPDIRMRMREELGLAEKNVIGHVGRFEQQKNHEFLIRIFAQIRKRDPNAVLLLVGDGVLRKTTEEQVRFLGLEGSVIFAGVQERVCDYYQAMDILVLPSLFEGKPFVIVEAQTAGLFCVISDKVPVECMVTENLVTVCGLRESPEQWAEHILSRLGGERNDRSAEVSRSGYDIHETARWLENYYVRTVAAKHGS